MSGISSSRCLFYLVNHHNLRLVQLHSFLVQDLNEPPRGGYYDLLGINRRKVLTMTVKDNNNMD